MKKEIEQVRKEASQELAGLLQAGDGGKGSNSSSMRSPGVLPSAAEGAGGDPGVGGDQDSARQLHRAINPFAPTGKGTASPPALKSRNPYTDACSKLLSKSWMGTVDTPTGLNTRRHQLALQKLG